MRLLTCILCLILFISSCRDKVICPAFQSTYILDDSVRLAYFSYLWELDDKDRISYLENRRNTKDSLVALSSDTLTIDSIPGSKMGEVDYFAYSNVETYFERVELRHVEYFDLNALDLEKPVRLRL